MTTMPNPVDVTEDALPSMMDGLADRVARWLDRQRRGRPVGVFSLCDHATVDAELNAATAGIELWTMLGLPLTEVERREAIVHLRRFQLPHSGLVRDPTWDARERSVPACRSAAGDTFFTMTAQCALESLGSGLAHPVAYLGQPSRRLGDQIAVDRGAHHPWAIGDLSTLLRLNHSLGVAGSKRALDDIDLLLLETQDPDTGLWNAPTAGDPLTPSINLAFHQLRRTWNVTDRPYRWAEKMIDSCLLAATDLDFYGWDTGYACNDLDLAMVMYGASRWSGHRRAEIRDWAKQTLPVTLSIEKPDGGFSFYHDRAMTDHGGIVMSPGHAEGDMWGTLMYLGTIKLLTELAFPGHTAPWTFSSVHAVPSGAVPSDSSSLQLF